MKLKIILLFIIVLLKSQAFAGGLSKGLYTGIDIGATKNKANTSNLVTNPNRCATAGGACRADTTDQGAKIYFGYPLNKNWAIEAEYTDLGKIINGSVNQGGVNDQYSQKTNGVGLSVLGKIKANSYLSLYGKVGVFHWISKADASFSPSVTGFGASTSRKEAGTDALVGVGTEYALSKNWSLRLGWDRYFNVGETGNMLDEGTSTWRTLDTDVDFYSLGINYRF
ncbi:outer membrane beta-barrel protein [Thiofilum flexile]|uniref:outer membrane beta-barrel protein n=1 Tax=Thiofilum flexile TaxID=125627 RepID=UPI00036DD4D1|nr:outer membrane beta-barrel protein [Thiofilum flexile]